MSTLRELIEAEAKRFVGEWDGDEADVFADHCASYERVAREAAAIAIVQASNVLPAPATAADVERILNYMFGDETK